MAAAVAAVAAVTIVAGWVASGQLGGAAPGNVLLTQGAARTTKASQAVAAVVQTALREDGKVRQLQGEVKTLDNIRNAMLNQLAHQPTSHLRGGDRLKVSP